MDERRHGHRVAYLDGWRGVAILLVLAGQFFPLPGINLSLVGSGLFFALSGVLIARELFLTKTALPTFWRRRMARIAPASLAFVGCMAWWFNGSAIEISAEQIASALTFTSNYYLAGPQTSGTPLGHLWFLGVVMQSCLLMSFIAYLVRRKITESAYAVGCTAAVFAACAMAYWALDSAWRFTSTYRFHMEVAATGIFASCFLAIYWTSAKKLQSRFALPALFVLAFAANLAQVPPALHVVLGGAAFALAINLVDQSNGLIRNVLESRLLQRLSAWSFSIFLWQQPFYLMANQGDIDRVTGIVGALVCGITAFHLIEAPARAWLNRNWARRTRLTLAYSATVSPLR